jgi:hypothetical protein
LFPALIHGNIGPPHSILCSKSMVDKVGRFDPGLRSCEDYDLWIRIATEGVDLVPVHQIGALYRQSPGSMSTSHMRLLETRAQVLVKACRAFFSKPGALSPWGHDLAAATQRVYRRCLSQKANSGVTSAMLELLVDFRRQGHMKRKSWKYELVHRLAGTRATESVVLLCYKVFNRDALRWYRRSHS